MDKEIAVRVDATVYRYTFLGTLAFVVGQQIYWPQALQYFHLAILFVFMVFNDIRAHHARNLRTDAALLVAVVAASAISIAEAVAGVDLGLAYRGAVTVAGGAAIKAFLDLRVILAEKRVSMVAERHQSIFDKSTVFPQVLLVVTCVVIVVAIGYVFSDLLI